MNPSHEQLLQENHTLQQQIDELQQRCFQLQQENLHQGRRLDYQARRVRSISWDLPVQTPFDPQHHLSFLSHSGVILGLLVAAIAIPLFALGMSGRKVLPLGKLSLACSTSNSIFFLLSGLGITGAMVGLKNNLDASRKQKHLNHYEKALRAKEVEFQHDSGFKEIYPFCKALHREKERNDRLATSLSALGLYQAEANLESGTISLQEAHERVGAPKDITTRLQLVTWMREQRHLLASTPGKLARVWLAIHKPVLHMVSVAALVGGIALVAFGSLLIAAHWKGRTSLQFLKWTVLVEQQDAIGYCIKGASLMLTAAGLELYVRGNDEAYLRKHKTVTQLADTLQLALDQYRFVIDSELKHLISSHEIEESDDSNDEAEQGDEIQRILGNIQRERTQLEQRNNQLYGFLTAHLSPLPQDLDD